MIFSDVDIAVAITMLRRHPKSIKVVPYDSSMVQPASLDVRLGDGFLRQAEVEPGLDGYRPPIDPRHPAMDWEHVSGTTTITPGEFMLASTMEYVELGSGVAGQLEGRSSVGRLGLMVHVTAGYIDPGFAGNITLELFNASRRSIRLEPGLRIAQIVFHALQSDAVHPYGFDTGAKYLGQTGPTPSAGV